MPDGSDPIDALGNPKPGAIFPPGLGLYLHHFHRSDRAFALHNHPWRWAYAFILAGGYREERREADDTVRTLTRRPGSLVRIRDLDFHRVDLIAKDSWSLFLAGPKVANWGFWDRDSKEFTPWRLFLAKTRGTGP
jgi:hypothetical protein